MLTPRFRHWLLTGLLLTLSACGSKHIPLANSPIYPKLEADGGEFIKKIEAQSGLTPMTLLEAVLKQGVPPAVAKISFANFDRFQGSVRNRLYVSVIDYTQSSKTPRFYMINTTTGKVDSLLVAHGFGSDPKDTGIAQAFSNTPDSKMTSLGTYLVNERYHSVKHGVALKLDGLEATNSLARPRALLIHSAKYVDPRRPKIGMSWGCPAVSVNWIVRTLQRLADGSLLYAYGSPSTPTFDDPVKLQRMLLDPSYRWVDEADGAPIEGAE